MARPVTLTEEVPGLYRIAVPLWPRHPLGHVNVYLILSEEGPVLIDCGPDTPEAFDVLRSALGTLGIALQDVQAVFLTHTHPDHCGLLRRLSDLGVAQYYAHAAERPGTAGDDVSSVERWFVYAGVPEHERPEFREVEARFRQRPWAAVAATPVRDEEHLPWSPFSFRALWVPGHAPDLFCLYEPTLRILIASDHVLPDTSPHVGSFPHHHDKPLSAYLASLERIRRLPIERTLPGHGHPFDAAHPRIEELLAHHRDRLGEIVEILAEGPATAFQVATRLSWMGRPNSWVELDAFQRFLALTETLAHLEHLVEIGEAVADDGSFALLPL